MRCFSHIALAAGLVCCLAASPARADLVAPETASAQASAGEILTALQALTYLSDAASGVAPASALSSAVKSTGPTGVALSSEGVDSSGGPVDTWTISGAGFGNTDSSAAATGAAYPASAPSGLQVGGHLVGSNAAVAPYDLSSLASSASDTPVALDNSDGGPDPNPPAVPIPPSALLLGAGLLCIYPLRRSPRWSVGA